MEDRWVCSLNLLAQCPDNYSSIQRVTSIATNHRPIVTFEDVVLIGAILVARHYFTRWRKSFPSTVKYLHVGLSHLAAGHAPSTLYPLCMFMLDSNLYILLSFTNHGNSIFMCSLILLVLPSPLLTSAQNKLVLVWIPLLQVLTLLIQRRSPISCRSYLPSPEGRQPCWYSTEILELGGKTARNNNEHHIVPCHLHFTIWYKNFPFASYFNWYWHLTSETTKLLRQGHVLAPSSAQAVSRSTRQTQS